MDLVASVRKEGSRGGRGDFKWSDVKESSHRENYLGHSLMAPVGRWQQGKDLSWYARGEENPEEKAKQERDERQRVKDAEAEAMALALGLPPPPKSAAGNANLVPLGGKEGQDVAAANEGVPSDKGRDSRDYRRRRCDSSRSPRNDRESDRPRDRDRSHEHKHRRHRDERDRRHHHRSHRDNHHRSRSRDRDRIRRRSRSRSRDRRDGDWHRRRWDERHRTYPSEKDSNHHRRH